MCRDALDREESCGCHFREEHQTADHEALRNDEDFSHVTAWEYPGVLHKEPLEFRNVHPTQRSYK
jgi:succinate dehydrogenase / fumarate reductase flavoprotein subunit